MIWFFMVLAVVIFVAICIWFLQKFYAKATLNSSLVRTGLGGMQVILSGGCFALPIVHQTQRVSMGAATFGVLRSGKDALMTGDQFRAEVEMEFEFCVESNVQGVATAAQTFGAKIERGGDAVEPIVRGPIVNALQDAAAKRTLDEMHTDRASFTQDVSQVVGEIFRHLGLKLISASLLKVDQSDLSQFDENNAFDAQGMRRHAELISKQRRERVQIQTEADLAVRESALAKHQRQLEIERIEREATLTQQESLDRLEAQTRAQTEEAKFLAKLKSETVRIETEQKISAAKIENDESMRRSEMAAIRVLEEKKIEDQAHLTRLRTVEYETQASEEAARAQVILASEEVQARKDHAIATREHETALLRLNKDTELSSLQAKSDAETLAMRTQAEAEAARTLATAELARSEAETAGRAALIAAENTMSESLINMRLEERRLDRMPEIMTQMMKPVEKIDSIKINQISGLGGGASGSGEGGSGVEGAFGSAMEQILGMAVRLPAMKQMGEEIGLDFDANIAGRTADYANRIKTKDEKKEN